MGIHSSKLAYVIRKAMVLNDNTNLLKLYFQIFAEVVAKMGTKVGAVAGHTKWAPSGHFGLNSRDIYHVNGTILNTR